MKSMHKRSTSPEAAPAPSLPTADATSPVLPAANLPGNANTRLQAFQARYDAGGKFDSGLRYVVNAADTTPAAPVAKVKMELRSRDDENLDYFVGNHIDLITGNPNYLNQQPPPADLLAAFNLYETKLVAHQQMRDLAKQATLEKDQARKALEDLMVRRGAYVQEASAGNPSKILAVGLDVASPRTPMGPLTPPTNLRTFLGEFPGMMELRWEGSDGARAFLVQCSPDVMPRQFSNFKSTTKRSLGMENLTVGDTLVFRVAAQGGSTGESPWSAEVIRTVG